jgi:hypothetical protein
MKKLSKSSVLGEPRLLDWRISGLAALDANAPLLRFSTRRGMREHHLKSTLLSLALLLLSSAAAYSRPVPDASDDDTKSGTNSSSIVQKYLQVVKNNEEALRATSMKVDIQAAVPGLKEHGRLLALRIISKLGQITYKQLGFQGDTTVKKDVIARYLQAEQQGQGDPSLAITPANYKFKYKGLKTLNDDRQVYVLQLTPHKKRVGLFKGQLWLDSQTYFTVVEKGRLVKNPSIFFKKVDFERDFITQGGVPVPQHLSSTIDVRLVGTVELSIDYSDFQQHAGDDSEESRSAAALTGVNAR